MWPPVIFVFFVHSQDELKSFDKAFDNEEEDMYVSICGHAGGSQSHSSGRLLFELNCIPKREMDLIFEEINRLDSASKVGCLDFFVKHCVGELECRKAATCTVMRFGTGKWAFDANVCFDPVKKTVSKGKSKAKGSSRYKGQSKS